MPFIEISPPLKQPKGLGTGVRLGVSERMGLRISLAGEALTAIAGRDSAVWDQHTFKVLLDADPALPRLRIMRAGDGRFALSKPPLGDTWRFITVGRVASFPVIERCGCSWESVDHSIFAIDIDLPRELRATSTHQPVGRPSTSTGPRPSPVTLPGVRTKERA